MFNGNRVRCSNDFRRLRVQQITKPAYRASHFVQLPYLRVKLTRKAVVQILAGHVHVPMIKGCTGCDKALTVLAQSYESSCRASRFSQVNGLFLESTYHVTRLEG